MDKPVGTTVTVGARVPPHVRDALLSVCHSERRTLSQVVRNILLEWYERQKGKPDDRQTETDHQ